MVSDAYLPNQGMQLPDTISWRFSVRDKEKVPEAETGLSNTVHKEQPS